MSHTVLMIVKFNEILPTDAVISYFSAAAKHAYGSRLGSKTGVRYGSEGVTVAGGKSTWNPLYTYEVERVPTHNEFGEYCP